MSPSHIISNGFQPPPNRSIPPAIKSQRTRKRLSMNFTSIPVVNSSEAGLSSPSTRSASISSPRTPGLLPASPFFSQSASSPTPSTPKSSKNPASDLSLSTHESLSNLNDALMNKSHRILRSRSTSLTLPPHSSASHNLNSQLLPSVANIPTPNSPVTSNSLPTSSSQTTLTPAASLSSTSPSPLVSSANTPFVPHHQSSQSVSSVTSNSSASPAASSAIEYYFSQLAYRERRIVELRDEIKRMQQKLKQAEDDLEDFKKQVPTKDLIRPNSHSSSSVTPQQNSLKRSASHKQRLVNSNSPSAFDPSTTQNQSSANRRSSYPVLGHASNSSTSTTSSSRHSNSLSDSSASSMTSSILEETDEECNTTLSTSTNVSNSAFSGKSNPAELDSSQTQPPYLPISSPFSSSSLNHRTSGLRLTTDTASFDDDSYYSAGGVHTGLYDKHIPQSAGATDQVLHMGKRVVEELGTQFWSFIEDIKNVTVGDDARDPTNSQLPSQYHHGKSKSLAVNQASLYSPNKTRSYLNAHEIELKTVDNPKQSSGWSQSSFPSSSTSFGRLTRSTMSMGNLNSQLLNETDDLTPTGSQQTLTTPATTTSPKLDTTTNNLTFDPNRPSVSVSSISTKGMASEMGAAVSRHRTKNSVSLGRSATVGGGMTRRLTRKPSENSYYVV